MGESSITHLRRRVLNDAPVRAGRAFVLYWMTATRRTRDNYALDRALELCAELGLPLVVLEPLRVDYEHASDRHHRFVVEGMAANAAAFAGAGVRYHPYVEPEPGAGRGLLAALAARAAVVVADDSPVAFLPRMLAAAAQALDVQLEAVDSVGLVPLRAGERLYVRAVDFRRFVQRDGRHFLDDAPRARPLQGTLPDSAPALPRAVLQRWPAADLDGLLDGGLAELPIDHDVAPVDVAGGSTAAERALRAFLKERFERYGAGRNQPDDDPASGLSPWLHYGHLSAHRVFAEIVRREDWSTAELRADGRGQREGWWGMSPSAESFLDQLITWRELGQHFAARRPDHRELSSLPDWARATLAEHADDERPHVYSLAQFEAAETHDELWNAAQTELSESGRMHNYLRMLWGKKILHWSASPAEAARVMLHLNDKYALDGRDPNSTSGIFWVLGRFDRPWGPERPVFGKVRYMASGNTHKKLRLTGYLERWGPARERQSELF